MYKNKNKKGQIFNLDLVIAASIFIFILLTIIWAWNDIRFDVEQFENKRLINQKALHIADILVKTPGTPVYWHELDTVDSDTVDAIGLTTQDNILDQKKLDKLSTVDYEEAKRILGLSKEEFNITIYNLTDSLYSYGLPYNETRIKVSRYVLLDNDLVEIRLTLFYNTSTYLAV